jgi:hypothetical protein
LNRGPEAAGADVTAAVGTDATEVSTVCTLADGAALDPAIVLRTSPAASPATVVSLTTRFMLFLQKFVVVTVPATSRRLRRATTW